MEVAINYTVYLGDSSTNELEDYFKFIDERHQEIIRELGYVLLRNTYGFHRNAERSHLHYHSINSVPEGSKVYKILNDKIKRLKTYKNYSLPHSTFVIPEVKISFNYSNNAKWDVDKILAYPLKEYDTHVNMFKEIKPDNCLGVSQINLEKYRETAHAIYLDSLKEHAKKQEKITKKQDLYSHLNQVVSTHTLQPFYGDIDLIVRFTVKQMLIYYKDTQQCFSVHQLKNTAINYLYLMDIMSETMICDYMNI